MVMVKEKGIRVCVKSVFLSHFVSLVVLLAVCCVCICVCVCRCAVGFYTAVSDCLISSQFSGLIIFRCVDVVTVLWTTWLSSCGCVLLARSMTNDTVSKCAPFDMSTYSL